MIVGELTESEQVVLVALVGLMARADGSVSDSEMETLQDLREGIGEGFQAVRDQAAAFADAEGILRAAGELTRPEARESIFHVLVGMAAPDTISDGEAEIFRRLAALWGLQAPFSE